MRIFSIVSALLVAVALYAFIIERDRVLALLQPAEGSAVASETTGPAQEEAEAASTDRVVRVIALRSSEQVIESGVVLRGQTEAQRSVDVRSQATGLVVSEPQRKGAFVSTGLLLCELDPGSSSANLAEAVARLDEARTNERAASRLAEEGFGSEARRNSAQAALEAAAAAVERAMDAQDRLTMRAPFNGLLESDTAEIGSLLQPGSLCAHIIQLDPINIVGFVPEKDVDLVEVGYQANVRFLSGRTVSGEVTFVSRSADPDTRTFRVEITAANTDLTIRDGSSAEIFIHAQDERAHLLPQSSLTLGDGGRLGVRLAEQGRARFYPVSIIRDTVEGAWVAGLPASAEIIIVGHEYVTDGTGVEVSYRSPGQ